MKTVHSDIKEILLTNTQLTGRIAELAKEIDVDYAGKNPVLLCLLKGSVPFLGKLCEFISIPMTYECIRVSSYIDTTSSQNVKIQNINLDSLKGKDILIIEDIIDTGITLEATVKYLYSIEPKSIEIMTLLSKPSRRQVLGLEPKYIGFIIPDAFVVGFGLDYNENYRNYPHIGILKEEIYRD